MALLTTMTKRILIITTVIVVLTAIGATATYIALRQEGEEVTEEQLVATKPEEKVVQPEEPATAERIDIPIEDPYCSTVLGDLLRLPILLDELSTELNLNESQRNGLAKVVEEINKPGGTPIAPQIPAIEDIDARVKKLLSPFQYVRFRDWIIEEWELEKGEVSPAFDEIAKLGAYTIDFLRSELELAKFLSQKISNSFFQHKKRALPLRRKLVTLAQNPLITWEQLNTEGQEIINQIGKINQQMLESMMNELTPQQRVILNKAI